MKYLSLKVVSHICLYFISFVFLSSAIAAENDKKAYLHSTQDPIDSILPMLGGLAIILVFIFLLAYLFKRFSHFNGGSNLINIVETCAIGNKEKLAIVKVENESFLIGITSGSINSIGKLDSLKIENTAHKKVLVNPDKPDQNGFASLIAKFMSGKMVNDITERQAVEKKVAEKCQ